MRVLKTLVLILVALILVALAMANADAVTLRLLSGAPADFLGIDWNVTLPAFVVIGISILAGVLIGMTAEFSREHKYRAAARSERRERKAAEQKLADARARRGNRGEGDEILSLLEDGSVPVKRAS